jgi:caspase domain-containing protein
LSIDANGSASDIKNGKASAQCLVEINQNKEKIMARFLLSALGVIILVFSAEIERTPALATHHQIPIQSEPAQRPAIQEKRVALIIGNGAYVGANPLRNPPNDARSMSAALRQIGFDVIERIDLNSREMKRAVIEFGNKLRSNDVGLFYYAGHGVQSNGKNYLIPVDAEIEKEADIAVDGVDLDTVMAQIEGAKNRLNIVILDACRNDFSTRGWNNPNRGLLQVAVAPSGPCFSNKTFLDFMPSNSFLIGGTPRAY